MASDRAAKNGQPVAADGVSPPLSRAVTLTLATGKLE